MDTNEEFGRLQAERAAAASRVSDLEAEWREAVEASRVASAALAEVERHGGSATARHKAEEALSRAKLRAGEPWPERLEGLRAASRDVDRTFRQFVAEHLDELVGAYEADGRVEAEGANAAVADFLAHYNAMEGIARKISSLITLVARPSPADVSRPKGAEVARAAVAFAGLGGEEGPTLDRSRPPWAALLAGEHDPADADDPEPVAVNA